MEVASEPQPLTQFSLEWEMYIAWVEGFFHLSFMLASSEHDNSQQAVQQKSYPALHFISIQLAPCTDTHFNVPEYL